jgi:hypothetical protein
MKKLNDSQFINQEHVIPACIGGIHKLPKGYVSDEVNKLFSPCECHFARETMILLSRMILGPGKRGSLNHRKATASEITIIEDISCKEKKLGFIKQGVPFTIKQIYFFNTSATPELSKKAKFLLTPVSGKSNEELLLVFWKQIETYENYEVIIKSDFIEYTDCILGIHEDKWYLATNTEHSDDEAKQSIAILVKNILYAKEKIH